VRHFYETVTGWSATSFSMGDHDDYCINPAGSTAPVAGICRAKGENAGLPPVWINSAPPSATLPWAAIV